MFLFVGEYVDAHALPYSTRISGGELYSPSLYSSSEVQHGSN